MRRYRLLLEELEPRALLATGLVGPMAPVAQPEQTNQAMVRPLLPGTAPVAPVAPGVQPQQSNQAMVQPPQASLPIGPSQLGVLAAFEQQGNAAGAQSQPANPGTLQSQATTPALLGTATPLEPPVTGAVPPLPVEAGNEPGSAAPLYNPFYPTPVPPNIVSLETVYQPVLQPFYLQGQPNMLIYPSGLVSSLANVSPLALVSPLQLPFRYYLQSGGGDTDLPRLPPISVLLPLFLADSADTPSPPVVDGVNDVPVDMNESAETVSPPA
jgi:hypothetical protein